MVKTKTQELKNLELTRLQQAFNGWAVWHSIVKKYKLKSKTYNKTAVVLLPQDDLECCYFALLYAERMLRLRGLDGVVFLTHNNVVAKAAEIMCPSLLGTELLPASQNAVLTQYYNTRLFDPRFIHASLTEPFARNGRALIGVKGITVEEAVAIGIYKIIPYVRKIRPKYTGEDQDMKNFFAIGEAYTEQRTTGKII